MAHTSLLRPGATRLIVRFWQSGAAIPLVFVVVVALLAPIAGIAEFDPDEGINLIKAAMMNRGYSLYTDIWSDQPPLLTLLLGPWLKWQGNSLASARLIVLLLSGLLLWSFFLAVRASLSTFAAWLSVLLLVFSAFYVRLSISLMVGLPALALATFSVCFALRGGYRRSLGIVASGVALGLALQTKLVAGIVVPAILAHFLLERTDPIQVRPWPRILRSHIIPWAGAALFTYLLVGVTTGSLHFDQLLGSHLVAEGRAAAGEASNLAFLGAILLRHVAYVPLALVGVGWAIAERKRASVVPIVWLFASVAFLVFVRLVWYHHLLVLTIPLAWLAAFGVEAVLSWLRKVYSTRNVSLRPVAGGATLVLALVTLMFFVVRDPTRHELRSCEELRGGFPLHAGVLGILQGDASAPGSWVFTDRPYYAMFAGLPVPPWTAALTHKRLISGALSDETMLSTIDEYHPQHIVLERFLDSYSPDFRARLLQSYEVVGEYIWGGENHAAQILAVKASAGAVAVDVAESQVTATFDGSLRLTWRPMRIARSVDSGEWLTVHGLEWTELSPGSSRGLRMSLRLSDPSGLTWAQQDGPVVSDVHPFIPEGTPTGSYAVTLIVYDGDSRQPLVASAADGNAGQTDVHLATVEIRRPEPIVQRKPLADFGPLRLVEASTPAAILSPGDELPVTLLWQAAPDYSPEPLVVVVQLLGSGGAVVVSQEEEPLSGRLPTIQWQPGELVRDRHALTVPSQVASGEYELIAGLYRPSDRFRLATRAQPFCGGPSISATVRQITIR